MITIGLAGDIPEGATRWIPIFYVDDTEVAPGDALDLYLHWYTREVGTGKGLFDLWIGIYSETDPMPIFQYSTGFIEWEDGNYIFDVGTRELTFEGLKAGKIWWWLAAAGLGMTAVVISKRRGK